MTTEVGKVRILALKNFKLRNKKFKFFSYYTITDKDAAALKAKGLIKICALPATDVKK